jgi:hypothetical protein
LLRHPRAREVNRASSVIYGNTLAVILTAPWGLATLTSITGHDLVGVAILESFNSASATRFSRLEWREA